VGAGSVVGPHRRVRGRRRVRATGVDALGRVAGMSDDQIEPGGITERFRAFAQGQDPPPDRNRRTMLLVAGAAVLVVALAVVWIAFGG
jgi:hypothetical protein